MLYELINVVHSGFLNGRFIEENVKMIYNTFTMQHTEQNQIPALLMLIDFENVFDTISWKFIEETLNVFWDFDQKVVPNFLQ